VDLLWYLQQLAAIIGQQLAYAIFFFIFAYFFHFLPFPLAHARPNFSFGNALLRLYL
jgi:hypothetical protein